jgi:hypothetical protein
MSNIQIDNPNRLLALAEQMEGFKTCIENFIDNTKNTVKTTIDHLTRVKISTKKKIDELENKIIHEEDQEVVRRFQSEIQDARMKINKIKEIIEETDRIYKRIVKSDELLLTKSISQYPKGIDSLKIMEQHMKKYLEFSSDFVRIPKKSIDNYSNNENVNENFQNYENFTDFTNLFREYPDANTSSIAKMQFSTLKNNKMITSQMLVYAELEAQKKKTKIIEFKVFPDTNKLDEETFKKNGYKIYLSNGSKFAIKNLHGEIILAKPKQGVSGNVPESEYNTEE